MKRLIVYDYEVDNIVLSFPYIRLTEEAFKKWLENKLKTAGFDLDKI